MSPGLIVGILSALVTLLTPILSKRDVNGEDCAKAVAMLGAGGAALGYHRRNYVRRSRPDLRRGDDGGSKAA